MSDEINQFDTVTTPEGTATVVGFLPERGEVEVRYPNRNLRMWQLSQVRKVEADKSVPFIDPVTPAPPALSYQEAREQGIAPPPDLAQFGDLGGPQPAANPDAKPKSTLAEKVARGEPTSPKTGRRLTGAARTKALAKQEREREG